MLVFDCLFTLIESICVIYTCKKYLDKATKPYVWDVIILISNVLLANFAVRDTKIFTLILGQVFIFLICYVNAKKLLDSVYMAMLVYITLFISEIIATIPVAFCSIFIKEPHILGLIGNLMTLAVIIILMSTSVRKLYNMVISTSFAYKVALISFYIVLISLLIICQQNVHYLYSNILLFIIIIIIIITSNALLLYYEKIISSKNAKLKYYKKYLPVYENLINDIRASQHEFTNRIQSLQLLCDSHNTDDEFSNLIKNYTATYTKPLHAYPLLTLKNPLFVASMYSLYLDAQAREISINYDVTCGKLESSASEITITDLSAILVQNAIEASVSGNNIYISINSSDNKTTIEVRNLVDHQISDSEISLFFSNSYSTKNKADDNETHGFGLYYLNKQVSIYKGSILATCINHNSKYWMIFKLTI